MPRKRKNRTLLEAEKLHATGPEAKRICPQGRRLVQENYKKLEALLEELHEAKDHEEGIRRRLRTAQHITHPGNPGYPRLKKEFEAWGRRLDSKLDEINRVVQTIESDWLLTQNREARRDQPKPNFRAEGRSIKLAEYKRRLRRIHYERYGSIPSNLW